MDKIKLNITLVIFLIGFFGNAQNLACNDFKEGKFYISMNKEIDTFYVFKFKENKTQRIEIKIQDILKKIIVVRTPNSQIEWKNDLNDENPIYEKIEWIDECKYVLKKDGDKNQLDKYDLFILENGGLIVEKLEINGKCMKYKSSVILENGDEMYTIGNICKE